MKISQIELLTQLTFPLLNTLNKQLPSQTLPRKSEVPGMRLLEGRKLCYTIHLYYDEVS